MSQTKSCRGVSRVLAKLEESVQCGKYYEAHQKYRTLYFRYLSQKRFDECLELLFSGAQILLDNQQYSSGADLGLLVVDTLEKSNGADVELWINRIGVIISKISPNLVERETLLVSACVCMRCHSNSNLCLFLLLFPSFTFAVQCGMAFVCVGLCAMHIHRYRSKQSNGVARSRKIEWDIR